VKVKHILIFLAIAGGVGLMALIFVGVRSAAKRAADEEAYEQQRKVVPPEDVAMMGTLRERAAAIRKGREKFATRAALEGAVPDPEQTCEHPVPQLELHRTNADPTDPTRTLLQLEGTALNPTGIKIATDALVPVIPVDDDKIGVRVNGLAEAMDAVVKRLEVPLFEATRDPARADGKLLLDTPSREVMFLVEEVRSPKVDFADGGDAPTSFTMGAVRGRAVLVDQGTGTILCAAEVTAENSAVVNFSYQVEQYGSLSIPQGSPGVRAMMAAHDDLWRQVAAAVGARRLQALTPAKQALTPAKRASTRGR
jgi:hypothetical protein